MFENNPEIWDEEDAEYIDSNDYAFDDELVSDEDYSEDEIDYADYDTPENDDQEVTFSEGDAVEETPSKSIWKTIVYMLVVLLVSAVFAVGIWFAADDILALTKPNTTVVITIEENDTLYDVAQKLQDHGLVRYKYLFMLYGKMSHAEQTMAPGTFELNQMYDYHALVNGLVPTSESRKTVTLTFPEGLSVDQIFTMLVENDVCSEEELVETAADHEFEYEFLSNIAYGDYKRLEGFMFPDTYDFYIGDDPVRVLNKFLNNFDGRVYETIKESLNELNASIRTAMEEEGSFSADEIDAAMMDAYKVVTLASLIEKEAGSDGERTLISSVIYNRLTTHVHELLQIDATVEYALGEHKQILTANDLGVDNPYNTYRYKGLPPGPIANPGILSIMAAMHPEDTEYFFYALNDYGTHEFFYTYMEQQDFLNSMNSENTEETNQNDVQEATDASTEVQEEVADTAADPAIPAPEADLETEGEEMNVQ